MAATQQDRSSAPTPIVNGVVRHRAIWPLEFYRSAVGKKWVMAISGLVGIGFLVGHLVGNLKVYTGAESFNHYAEFLRELLYPIVPRTVTLWLLRFGLIGAIVLHLHAALTLTRMNHRAHPESYATKRDYTAANFASRTMRYSGLFLLAFIIFHIFDLTGGTLNGDFVRGDAYNNLVHSLGRPPVALFYGLANITLGLHLLHGTWSMFQSLGLNNPRFNNWRRRGAQGLATFFVLGNLSFPIAATVGAIEYDNEARLEACESRQELTTSKACIKAEEIAQREDRGNDIHGNDDHDNNDYDEEHQGGQDDHQGGDHDQQTGDNEEGEG